MTCGSLAEHLGVKQWPVSLRRQQDEIIDGMWTSCTARSIAVRDATGARHGAARTTAGGAETHRWAIALLQSRTAPGPARCEP